MYLRRLKRFFVILFNVECAMRRPFQRCVQRGGSACSCSYIALWVRTPNLSLLEAETSVDKGLNLFPFSHKCHLLLKSCLGAHVLQSFIHCLASIVEFQDCRVAAISTVAASHKHFPSSAKTPHQTLVWLLGILCRTTETSLQQLFAS